MKTKITHILTSSLAILFLTVTFSCEKMNPSEPELSDTRIETTGQNINILAIGGEESSLEKITTKSKWITSSLGGKVELRHNNDDLSYGGYTLSIASRLQILPNTLSEDAEISLSIDDEQFTGAMDVVFAPHGITFSSPALLSISTVGLDLSGVDVNNLNIYYANEETGLWELMEYASMSVTPEEGRISIINAELPHFSRYAIGTE